jgi:hypothetical protein
MCTALTALAEVLSNDDSLRRSVACMAVIFSALQTHRLTDPEHVPFPLTYTHAYWGYCLQMGNWQFKHHFRMTRANFDRLCAETRPVAPSRTRYGAFDWDFKVGVFLWRMATGDHCRVIGQQFSISNSSVTRITQEVAQRFRNVLSAHYVRFPYERDEKYLIASCWEEIGGFPGVIGAIDGTHISFHGAPAVQNPAVYFDRKKNYSILAQAVVDNRGIFIDFDIGWPGSAHDARAFSESSFFRFMNDHIAAAREENPGDKWYVLGDSAYPLSDWLMKPYPQLADDDTGPRLSFNIGHARQRVAVENAFGRLKQRWRQLFCLEVTEVATAVLWTHTCMLLHNFCELRNDQLEASELAKIRDWLKDEENRNDDFITDIEAEVRTAWDERDRLASLLSYKHSTFGHNKRQRRNQS